MADKTRTRSLSPATRLNWLLDAAVFLGAVIAALSGVYFLYFVSGYQGGRNPTYGITLLFSRTTWDLIHAWAGVVMIAASAGFATPLGYQTHLMVYGPGGYRFSDFVKLGLPLDLIIMVIAVALAPWAWPF